MVTGSPTNSVVRAVGPVAVDSVTWRFKGQLNLTVVVKAAFAFVSDADMPRIAPEPVLADDVDHGKVPGRSIRFASNRAPYLGSTDVVLTGFACSPEGPVTSMSVRFGVYQGRTALLDKALLVRSDKPFDRMPLVYERAFGGLPDHPENPFGVGSVPGLGEPNILHPHDPQRVGGFGPISRRWPVRKRLLGSTPRSALDAPIAEIPDDFDWAYFQAAPADQQLGLLQGDEWIVLDGLHPTQARIRTRIPSARGLARVYGLSAAGVVEGQGLVLVLDTLHIDGAELRCHVVWRRSFPIPDEAALAQVRVDAGVEIRGGPVEWPARSQAHGKSASRDRHELTLTQVLPGGAVEEESDEEIALATLDILADEPEPQKMPAQRTIETMELAPDDLVQQRSPLPFEAGPSRLEHPSHYPAPHPRRRPPGSQTLTIADEDDDPRSLPFQRAMPSTPPPPPEPAPSATPFFSGAAPAHGAPYSSAEERAAQVPVGFRDAAPAARPAPPPAPAPDPTSWAWREEPAAPDAAPPPAKAAPPAPHVSRRVDVRGVLYGGRKRRG